MKKDKNLQKEIIYIYHVTQENSVNLIPLFHLKSNTDIKIATLAIYNDEIKEQLKDLKVVLEDKSIKSKTAVECKDYNEAEVHQIIEDNGLDQYDVIINIGGGQKSHTLFMHELYYTLHKTDCKPTLIYPDMTRTSEFGEPVIRKWIGEKAIAAPSKENILLKKDSLKLKHLLKAYGVEALRDVFMHDDTAPIFHRFENFYTNPDFRKLVKNFYVNDLTYRHYGEALHKYFITQQIDLHKSNEWGKAILKLNTMTNLEKNLKEHFKEQKKEQKCENLLDNSFLNLSSQNEVPSIKDCQHAFFRETNSGNNYITSSERIKDDYGKYSHEKEKKIKDLNGDKIKGKEWTPGLYFEVAMQKLVNEKLNKNIIDSAFNLHLFDRKSYRHLAELDILLMSDKGRLLAIDAKGGSRFEVKDYQSRLYIQKQSFGSFIEFTAILYCPHSDHNDDKVNPYLKIAYSYAKNNIDFYIYDPEATSIEERYLWNDGDQYIFDTKGKAGNHITFKIRNQHDLFERISSL